MKLKQVPEDFQVFEISERNLSENGNYSLYRMIKRDITTEHALQEIAQFLGIPRKKIGFAGTKDKFAVTEQDITIECKQNLAGFENGRIKLEFQGMFKDSLRLGMLEGNRFEITVRELKDEKLSERRRIPNYFDEQRFSTNNVAIGRHIIKSEFDNACKILQESDEKLGKKIEVHLGENKNDFVGAILHVPRHTLLMYVHAFQSFLFNKVLEKVVDSGIETVPLIGFASELEEPFESLYSELLSEENLTQRDFVVREIPWLTMEGAERKAFFELENFSANEREPDELNEGFEKQTLEFSLPKGCYATMAVKFLYGVTPGILE